MNEFIKSSKIDLVLSTALQNKNQFKIKGTQLPMNSKRIIAAIEQLCKLYNNNQGSRNFVIELVKKFLPFNKELKVTKFSSQDKAHDAILPDIYLIGTEKLNVITNRFIKSKEHSESMAIQQHERGDFESEKIRESRIKEWVESQSKKILRADIGYYAYNCPYYLCRESIFALKQFVTLCVQFNELQICSILANKEQKTMQKKYTDSTNTIGGRISNFDEIYGKLNPIKLN